MSAPLRLSILDEDPGSTPFDDLIAAHYRPIAPEDVRDRIELPALSPAALHEAVDRAVRGFTRRPGRHNRYMPVPGERALRTDDLVDFMLCYGHEYRLAIFRAADVRTGSLLDTAAVHGETLRQGSASAWDWTGAGDWLPADAIPVDAAFVFWSAHTSVLDGAEIPAGFWVPEREPMPAMLRDRAAFSERDIARMRGLSASFAAALGQPAAARHSRGTATELPIVVLEGGAVADAAADVIGGSPEVAAVIRHGSGLTIVPHPGAAPDALTALAATLTGQEM